MSELHERQLVDGVFRQPGEFLKRKPDKTKDKDVHQGRGRGGAQQGDGQLDRDNRKQYPKEDIEATQAL